MHKIKITLLIIALVLLGVIAGALFAHSIKPKPQTSVSPQANKPAAPSVKMYRLTYEKLSFQYPASWQLKDTSKNGQDMVVLTGPNNFTMSLQTGITNRPTFNAAAKIIYTQPATLAGQPIYFDVLSSPQAENLIGQVYVSKSKTDASDAPPAKNTSGLLVFQVGYPATSPGQTLQAGAKDENYLKGNSIVTSMHY